MDEEKIGRGLGAAVGPSGVQGHVEKIGSRSPEGMPLLSHVSVTNKISNIRL
jgi:hypothetical protein